MVKSPEKLQTLMSCLYPVFLRVHLDWNGALIASELMSKIRSVGSWEILSRSPTKNLRAIQRSNLQKIKFLCAAVRVQMFLHKRYSGIITSFPIDPVSL